MADNKWIVNKDVISGDVFYSITYEGSPNRLACRIPSEPMARMMAKAPQMAEELDTLRTACRSMAAEINKLKAELDMARSAFHTLNGHLIEMGWGDEQ